MGIHRHVREHVRTFGTRLNGSVDRLFDVWHSKGHKNNRNTVLAADRTQRGRVVAKSLRPHIEDL
jgi:hypothetical protein